MTKNRSLLAAAPAFAGEGNGNPFASAFGDWTTRLSPLLAVAVALAFTAGSAYAESSQRPSSFTGLLYPASVAGGSAASAPAASGSSAAPLSGLLRDWDRAGFSAPSKPAQFRVYGRDGFVTSGPGYNAMTALVRSAVKDSRGGRDQEALTKIAKVRSLLGR